MKSRSDPPIYFTTHPPQCTAYLVPARDRCVKDEGHDGMHRCGVMSWGILETKVQIPLKVTRTGED